MKKTVICLYSTMIILFSACTFDYGETPPEERETPDLVMENVVYVRVRAADPIARFQAERAERYEKQGIMIVQNFSFEQFGERGTEVNAFGRAGNASIDIESGDVFMRDNVRLEVESEDIILETEQLDWLDEPRTLSSGEEEVVVFQENGTSFTGTGFRADARWRTWEFLGYASGIFISDDDDDDREDEFEKIVIDSEIDTTEIVDSQQRIETALYDDDEEDYYYDDEEIDYEIK